ncbi:MAG: DUF2460 domain-containing protein [Nitrososphaeria archaeon]
MQKTKSKILTTLIITIFAISIFAAVPVFAQSTFEVSNVEVYDPASKTWKPQDYGSVGDQVRVTVTGVTPGGLVKLYWDAIKEWDGKAGFLAQAYAVGTTAKITFTVPEAVVGEHYVIVKDMDSGATTYKEFRVDPKITLDPSTVLPGDTVTVKGTGFAGSVSVAILFNPAETSVTGEPVGTGDGSRKSWTLAKKPVVPGSLAIYIDGTLVDSDEYTINHVTGAITFDTAPPEGVSITADYSYYTATVSTTSATNSLGSFSKSFKVPSDTAEDEYGVLALDANGNEATETLNVVLQKITLSPKKGLRDTTVTVSGRGFTAGKTVDILWWMAENKFITVVDDYPIASDGSFSTTFKVPLVPDPTPPGEDYTVEAIDSEGLSATATFTVISSAKITLSPKSGKVGATVHIEGVWFTPNSKVTFTFAGQALETSPSPVYTDESGYFDTNFEVPDVAPGSYTVKATDEEGVSATATFKVIVPIITIKTRATSYSQGDIISIYVNSSEDVSEAFLEITDPEGLVFWTGSLNDLLVKTESGWYVLKEAGKLMIQLPSDALIGKWNFTAYETEEKEDILATNLFDVKAKPSLDPVMSKLNDLSSQVAGVSASLTSLKDLLTSSIKDVRNDIAGVKSDLATLSDSMSKGFSSVNNAVGTLSTSVGNLGNTLSGQITNLGNTLSKSISDNANSLSGQISGLGNTLSKSISDNANSIQASIKNSQDATVSQVKSSVGDISTFLIIIGILAAITLVVEVAILLRRLS